MSSVKKIALVVAIVLVVIVCALAAIPLFFGDRITARVKAEIDNSVNAHVAWKDADLSLLRGFPNLALTLSGLSVAGIQKFENDTLLTMDGAKVVVDLGSAIGFLRSGKPIVIRELTLNRPVIRARRLADGSANWDITKPSETKTSSSSQAINISLKKLSIDNGVVTLVDRQSNLDASIKGLNEALNGDFAQEKFTLSTRTRIDSVSAKFGGIPYLNRVALELNANIDADMKAKRFTLAKDTLRLNKLILALGGTVTAGTPDLGLDLNFAAPSTAFSEILSLVPAIYMHDFDKLQTSGTMALNGQVKGSYGPKAFPALTIRAKVDNGTFRYPDLPLPAKDIAIELAVDNPGGNVDLTVINLKRFHALLGDKPVDATVVVRTPVSDPDADLHLSGAVNLADVARTVKLTGVSQLAGVVTANVTTHARVSDIDAKRYDRVAATGTIQASRVAVTSTTIPHPIAIDTVSIQLTPQTAQLTAFSTKIGKSDARATGTLDNLLGFVLRGEDLRGHAAVTSTHFDLDEWKSDDKTTEVIPVPPHIDFALDASVGQVTYGPLTLANVKGNLTVKDQRVTMHNLTMDMLKGAVVANGYYETVNAEKPVFSMEVKLTTLDIPAAFTSLLTVQKLTPIAKYAQGNVSGTLSLTGPLDKAMTPVFTALTGKGEIGTEKLVLQGAPVMEKLSSALSMQQLAAPGIGALKASFDVADGRLHLKPMSVKVAGIDLTASGSNGIDQSLQYDLALAVPRSLLGPAATSAIAKLASKAGQLGAQLPAGEIVQLLAKVTGTVPNPNVATNFAGMAASVKDAAQNAAKQIAAAATETVKQKVDSTADVAKAKARAEADKIMADAQRQADTIRATAKALADKMKADASVRIDSLVAKATNPIAKIAAQKAGDQLRTQSNQQADKALQEANARADALLAAAKQQADAIAPPSSP
ncbi:MAG TPA: AsmA-like C-terminal region-containing protein [Gemmatimonadaceae bacterium]|jgi:hypothetical protein